jgi:hypothetical protein
LGAWVHDRRLSQRHGHVLARCQRDAILYRFIGLERLAEIGIGVDFNYSNTYFESLRSGFGASRRISSITVRQSSSLSGSAPAPSEAAVAGRNQEGCSPHEWRLIRVSHPYPQLLPIERLLPPCFSGGEGAEGG